MSVISRYKFISAASPTHAYAAVGRCFSPKLKIARWPTDKCGKLRFGAAQFYMPLEQVDTRTFYIEERPRLPLASLNMHMCSRSAIVT